MSLIDFVLADALGVGFSGTLGASAFAAWTAGVAGGGEAAAAGIDDGAGFTRTGAGDFVVAAGLGAAAGGLTALATGVDFGFGLISTFLGSSFGVSTASGPRAPRRRAAVPG